MIGVFVDTFVVLTLNALVIISTLYTPDGILAKGYNGAVTAMLNKTNLVQNAFGSVMGGMRVRFLWLFVFVSLHFHLSFVGIFSVK